MWEGQPPPYFVTTLPIPFPCLPAIPSTFLLFPPSPPPFSFLLPPLKVLESKKTLMKHVISALQGEEFGMKVAALKCILFWSRSPQQLRTTLIDYEVWRPLQEVCVEEGWEASMCQCLFIPSCVHASTPCCYINMLHKSCCTAVLVLQLAMTVCAMFLCSCCPTEMRPSSFWPLLQWATFYYQSRQADRCVCVCGGYACVHACVHVCMGIREAFSKTLHSHQFSSVKVMDTSFSSVLSRSMNQTSLHN